MPQKQAVVTVAGGASVDFTINTGVNTVFLQKVKVARSINGSTAELTLWNEAAKTTIAYKTDPFSDSPYADPVEDNDGVINARGKGLITEYEDLDAGGLVRGTVKNNDSVQKDFTVTIDYESGPNEWVTDNFTLNGTTRIFTLTKTPAHQDGLFVVLNGVSKLRGHANGFTYDSANNQVTLTEYSAGQGPAVDESLFVRYKVK